LVQQGCGFLDMSSERPARVRTSKFGKDEELAGELPPTWTLQKFQTEVTSALNEYFLAKIVDEAVVRMRALLAECPGFADELGVLAIRTALDRDEAAQKAVLDLLSGLQKSGSLDSAALVRTFEKLFCTWEDIAIDSPKAPVVLLSMLFGCISCDVVHRDLLTKLPENLMNTGLAKGKSTLPQGHEMLMDVAAELKEFKFQTSAALEDYFSTASVETVERRLNELGQRQYQHEFVKKAIVMSFSQQDPIAGRESVLLLFQHLSTASELSKDDLQWGITRLLSQLSDLELDCPRASDLTIEFLTCMVADELVSVPFLRRCRILRIGGAGGLLVLDAAQRRTPEYSKKELGTVQFKREIGTMILEYFNSSDQVEFTRCVRDLAPLSQERGAELVRKVMHLAMERSGNECEQALKLLVSLSRNEEISEEILELGFDDLYRRMPDLILDVPDGDEMAKAFVVEAQKAGVLRDTWSIPENA